MKKEKIRKFFILKSELKNMGNFSECFKEKNDECIKLENEYMSEYFSTKNVIEDDVQEKKDEISADEALEMIVNSCILALNFEIMTKTSIRDGKQVKISDKEIEESHIKRNKALEFIIEKMKNV